MSIDLRTLILIIGILHLMQVLIFLYQYKVNKYLKGPGWWLAWSAIESFGFVFILLRGITTLIPLVILFQNIIIISGTVFIYIGIIKFFDKAINWKFITSFLVSYIALHLIFIFVSNNIHLRTLVLDAYLSIIAFVTAFTLYKNKNQSISATVNFNTAIFIAHGCIFAYRSVAIVLGTHVEDVFTPSVFNLVQYFDALIVGLLWTIGFIIMLNQRLNVKILEAKTHFEQIFNTSPDASLITRLDNGLIVSFNDNFLKIFGYTKEDLSGKSTLDINFWKDPNNRPDVIKMVKENGCVENYEATLQRKNGELITGLVSAKSIEFDNIPHLISVTRNITSRKEEEKRDQRNAETLTFLAQYTSIDHGKDFFAKLAQHLASALDANFVCIDILEGDGLNARTLAVWNDGNFEDNVVYALKDTPCGDVVGKQVCCFPASVTKFFPRDTVLIDLKAESYVGVTLWSHTGAPIGLIAVIKKIPLSNQKEAEDLLKLVSIRASAELERMKIEEIIKESEKRFALTLDALNDGLWDWNIQTGDAFFSPNYYSLLEFEFKEFKASYESWRLLVHPEELERVEKELQQSIENGKGFSIDLRMKMKSGSWKWVSTRGKVVERATDGKALRMVGILSDITERKRSETEINMKNKELERLSIDKDRFMSILAHDLKNPFNSILGFLELLTENIHTYEIAKIEKQIGIINNSAQHFYNLLEDLLMWARAQSGKIPFKPQALNFSEICTDVVENLSLTAISKNITIHPFNDSKTNVFADADMLKTILRNLISNAIKFSNSAGVVDVYTEQGDSSLTISVKDNGIGMSPEILNKLFDVSQPHTTKGTANESGTGLGLLICKEFVEKHDGKIWAESKEGKGTTFYFTLPIRQ